MSCPLYNLLAQEIPAECRLNQTSLVHAFVMGVLNPTRYILWLVRVEDFVSFAYRLQVNHIGHIHNIFLLLFACL